MVYAAYGLLRQPLTIRSENRPFILITRILALLLIQLSRSPVTVGAGANLDLPRFVPAALPGAWFGLAIFSRLIDRLFASAVNVLPLVLEIGTVV